MRKIAGDSVQVYSAGTRPGTTINGLSAESLAEVGRLAFMKPVALQLISLLVHAYRLLGPRPRGQTCLAK